MNAQPRGRAAAENIRHAVDGLKSAAASGIFGAESDFGPMDVEVSICDDSGWKDKWKEYFKPAKVGKTIVVKPTWENYEAQPGEKVLEIDPGMAFGTGTHETTSLCIKLMEDYMKPGDRVLDAAREFCPLRELCWAPVMCLELKLTLLPLRYHEKTLH